MDSLQLLIDLHRGAARLGPGGEAVTLQAIALSGLTPDPLLQIADMGCGTGASALVLAKHLSGTVLALELVAPFLETLRERARSAGLSDRIRPVSGSLDAPPFELESLDAIWSEGAIYNIGFGRGISEWRRYLKPGGVLAISELTWLTAERPPEIEDYWRAAYPEVDTASAKIRLLEESGYTLLGYFVLPQTAWVDAYFAPLQARFEGFLTEHSHSAAAQAVVEAERAEIDLYARFSNSFGYGFYVARRAEYACRAHAGYSISDSPGFGLRSRRRTWPYCDSVEGPAVAPTATCWAMAR